MAKSDPHNDFRRRLLEGELLVGTFVKSPSMVVAEVLAQTELDVLCFDTEHAPFDRRDTDATLLACRHAAKPALVRVPSSAPEHTLNALDCGATGIVVPHVSSVESARSCVANARYASAGRSYAGSPRAAGYGANSIAQNVQSNKRDTTVITQIEDLDALDCISEIAGVKGIDCFFIGMMDLTLALNANSAQDSSVIEAAEGICDAVRSAGGRLGIFIPLVQDLPFWLDRGVTLFLLASDHVFIKQGAAQLVHDVREHFPR